MINPFGYYASAKGMVLVPDLSGLSSSAAIAALSASGLDYSLGTDVDTSTSSLDNLVASQDPIANTLVDYSTVISFSLYNFVAAPPPPPPPCVPNFGDDCFPSGGGVGQIGCDGTCIPSVTVTYYCTTRSVAAGVSSYPSNQNETGSVCDSYATVCSTSGYPGAPTIPTCAPPPPPPPPPPPSSGCTTPRPYPECICLSSVNIWLC